MKQIRLGKSNKSAIVDDYIYEVIKYSSWVYRSGYAYNTEQKIFLHVFVLGKKDGFVVDHVNGDKLDNRRENLRHCTVRQNNLNRAKRKDATSSKFIGVSYDGNKKAYIAGISIAKGKRFTFACKNEKEAVKLYNFLAEHFHGQYARLNDI